MSAIVSGLQFLACGVCVSCSLGFNPRANNSMLVVLISRLVVINDNVGIVGWKSKACFRTNDTVEGGGRRMLQGCFLAWVGADVGRGGEGRVGWREGPGSL